MALSLENKLSITNTITQVGLLIFAIFGYFYTVIPLYGKAVLEEQVAKIQLEIDEKNKIISSKEKELLDIQNKIEKTNQILHEKQIENNHLKSKNDLTQKNLDLTVNSNLQMEKIFCFNSLDKVGSILDEKELKISEEKKKEISKYKEHIFKCVLNSVNNLNLEKDNKQKVLQELYGNKNSNFKKFDKNLDNYIEKIQKEIDLFKGSLKQRKEDIEKIKDSEPNKYKTDVVQLIFDMREFRNKEAHLFIEFSMKLTNDYNI